MKIQTFAKKTTKNSVTSSQRAFLTKIKEFFKNKNLIKKKIQRYSYLNNICIKSNSPNISEVVLLRMSLKLEAVFSNVITKEKQANCLAVNCTHFALISAKHLCAKKHPLANFNIYTEFSSMSHLIHFLEININETLLFLTFLEKKSQTITSGIGLFHPSNKHVFVPIFVSFIAVHSSKHSLIYLLKRRLKHLIEIKKFFFMGQIFPFSV
ncbi:hypothetical protein BpHYR1_042819 [Brachionus plicatilis]|uniref:Uncharacterized protein n=1 Tax=Brachionus plicatilis TaxID=10195 RepID=A0A3M7Q385_BRAPC|nr:hypothetical protein BpHYR1_042819 [Brachionus plicatilis]